MVDTHLLKGASSDPVAHVRLLSSGARELKGCSQLSATSSWLATQQDTLLVQCGIMVRPTTDVHMKFPTRASCSGNGGACGCGVSDDGKRLSVNRFCGNKSNEQVCGCGGAFHLSRAGSDKQWGGKLSQSGPEAGVAWSMGLDFTQQQSFHGWEGAAAFVGPTCRHPVSSWVGGSVRKIGSPLVSGSRGRTSKQPDRCSVSEEWKIVKAKQIECNKGATPST